MKGCASHKVLVVDVDNFEKIADVSSRISARETTGGDVEDSRSSTVLTRSDRADIDRIQEGVQTILPLEKYRTVQDLSGNLHPQIARQPGDSGKEISVDRVIPLDILLAAKPARVVLES
jgi:hypothetical protein